MSRRRRTRAGFIYVEYLIVLTSVGIVITAALLKLGPAIVDNYTKQKAVILEEAP